MNQGQARALATILSERTGDRYYAITESEQRGQFERPNELYIVVNGSDRTKPWIREFPSTRR